VWLGVEAMGSGSSKSASSSSSTASAAGGGEEKRRNVSGKGRRGRSLLPLWSSSCFRGVAAPCEGDAPAVLPPAAAVEVRVLPRATFFLRWW
jgi:hypothetical protein